MNRKAAVGLAALVGLLVGTWPTAAWADVAPEPAGLAVIGGLAIALCAIVLVVVVACVVLIVWLVRRRRRADVAATAASVPEPPQPPADLGPPSA